MNQREESKPSEASQAESGHFQSLMQQFRALEALRNECVLARFYGAPMSKDGTDRQELLRDMREIGRKQGKWSAKVKAAQRRLLATGYPVPDAWLTMKFLSFPGVRERTPAEKGSSARYSLYVEGIDLSGLDPMLREMDAAMLRLETRIQTTQAEATGRVGVGPPEARARIGAGIRRDFIPTREDQEILQTLGKAGQTLVQVDIEAGSGRPRSIVSARLPLLEKAGLVVRPHGPRKGYAITAEGKRLLGRN